jgi:hypothetical protein
MSKVINIFVETINYLFLLRYQTTQYCKSAIFLFEWRIVFSFYQKYLYVVKKLKTYSKMNYLLSKH